jgi:hypothetical protein
MRRHLVRAEGAARKEAWAIELREDPRQEEPIRVDGDTVTVRFLDGFRRHAQILQTVPPTLWNTLTGELFELPPIRCECGERHTITIEKLLEGVEPYAP